MSSQIKTADRANLKTLLTPLVKRIKALEGASGGGSPTEIPDATVTERGLMSAADKIKVDCIGSIGVDMGERELTIGAPNTVADMARDLMFLFILKGLESGNMHYDENTGLIIFESSEPTTIDEFLERAIAETISSGDITDEELKTPIKGLSFDEVAAMSDVIQSILHVTLVWYDSIDNPNDSIEDDEFPAIYEAYITAPKTVFVAKHFATNVATVEVNGLMSRIDKAKLDAYPFSPDFAAANHTHSGYAASDHTHDGLITPEDRIKLACIGTVGVDDVNTQFTAGSPNTPRKILTDIVNLIKFAVARDVTIVSSVMSVRVAEELNLSYDKTTGLVTFEDGEELTSSTYLTRMAGYGPDDLPPDGDPQWDAPYEDNPDYTSDALPGIVIGFFADEVITYLIPSLFDKWNNNCIISVQSEDEVLESLNVYCTTTRTFSLVTITHTATSEANGLMSFSDKKKLDSLTGATSITLTTESLNSNPLWVPTTGRLVVAEVSPGIAVLPVLLQGILAADGDTPAYTLEAGTEIHIIIKNNTGGDMALFLPTSSGYYAESDSCGIPAGGIGEVNAISDGTTIYLRAIS